MNSILKYILTTAVRDWLFLGLAIILLGAFGLSAMIGSTFLIEQVQSTTVYISGSFRIIFVIGMILFVCFNINKSFDNKEVEFTLSKSISRNKFIFSYLLGFTIVAMMILTPSILTILLFTGADKIGLFFWSLSMIFEILIIIAFSCLASLIMRSAVSSVLASVGFYILSRMMSFFVLTTSIPKTFSDVATFDRALTAFLKILSMIFPRLDLFAKSEWLIHGMTNVSDVALPIIQSLIYIPLMVFMCFYDFNKKEF